MRTYTLILSAIFLSLSVNAQTDKAKIKIALLSTMLFTPSIQDEYSNEKLRLTLQEQSEIDDVISKLTEYQPTKICIEVPTSKQEKIDGQFVEYLEGNYELKLNEVDLLGFQTAKKLNLETLTCINYLGKFDTDSLKLKSKEYGQNRILEKIDNYAKEFIDEINLNNEHLTMRENLIYLNTDSTLLRNLQMYTKFYASI